MRSSMGHGSGQGLSSAGRSGDRSSLTAAELAARLASDVDDLPTGSASGTVTTTLVLSARTRDALLYNFTIVCAESRSTHSARGKGTTSPQTLQQRRRTESSADAYDVNEEMLRLAHAPTSPGPAGADHHSRLSGRLSVLRVGSAMTAAEMLDMLQGIKVQLPLSRYRPPTQHTITTH